MTQVDGESRRKPRAKDLGSSNLWKNTSKRNQLGGGKRTGKQFIQSVISCEAQTQTGPSGSCEV